MTISFVVTSIILILIFSLTNGMKDGSNVMATAVASRSIKRKYALIIVSLAEFSGPFVFGTPVAHTVAKGIINVDILPGGTESVLLILSGIIGAIVWNFLTWFLRMPTSSSFALVGGLIGPVLYKYRMDAIPWNIFLVKVIGAMFLSPILGMIVGFLAYRFLSALLSNATLKMGRVIKRIQIASLIFLGINHGNNDSQKAMGIIALQLYLSGITSDIVVPFWVILISISTLTIGISFGGTKIIKTVGYKIFKIRPLHSFASQLSASTILLFSNLFGAPVSTTQIISSSVVGVGSAFRSKGVRWSLIITIVWSWLLTIPLAGIVSAGFYILLRYLLLA